MEAIVTEQASGSGCALKDLVLRVHGGPTGGEIVRLGERKATIGSDAACTYRIFDDHVRAVQCVILRGSNGSLVRRWADGILLNGEAFLDSHLKIGDRLMIGPVELEVIEDNALPSGFTETSPHQVEQTPDEPARQMADRLQAIETTWQEMCEGLSQEVACLQQERKIWQDERSRWESEMAEYQETLTGLTKQFDEFQQSRQVEHDAWLEELQQLQAVVEAAAANLDALPEEDVTLHHEEIVDPSDHGDESLPEDDGPQSRFDRFLNSEIETSEKDEGMDQRDEAQWPEDSGSFIEQPAYGSDTIRALHGSDEEPTSAMLVNELDTAETAYVTEDCVEPAESEEEFGRGEESQWPEENGAFLEQSDLASDAFDMGETSHGETVNAIPVEEQCIADPSYGMEDKVETVESHGELEQEETPLWQEHDNSHLHQPDIESDSFDRCDTIDEESADAISVGDQASPTPSYLMEDCDQGDSRDTDENTAPPPQPPSWLLQYQDQQEDSDSSIADYMNRLLQRVDGSDEAASSSAETGDGGNSPITEPAPSSAIVPQPPEAEPKTEGPTDSPAPEPTALTVSGDKEEYTPRNSAPERGSNMAALRELANASAQNAIETCDKSRTAKSAMGRIPLLLVELVCGGLMLVWSMRTGHGVAYAGMVVCFIAAAMTGVHTLWLFLRTALAAMAMPNSRETAERAQPEDAS